MKKQFPPVLKRADNILFLLPYPLNGAPSQRFRVEAYFSLLEKAGLSYSVACFLDHRAWKVLYKNGSLWQKALAVLSGFFRRAYTVFFKAGGFSYVFIHREAAPLGPPLFEWWLAKVLRKKIIYDFDDAIWIPNLTESNRSARFAKCFWKVKYICKWSDKVSAGNHFLADYARKYNPNVVYNPTCVDTQHRYNVTAVQEQSPVVIGWTGSHSTIQFLAEGIPALQKLEKTHSFQLLIICDQKPDFALKSLRFIPWNAATEIEDLAKINIGIMPLKDDDWSEGKCGFKIIQYLALGIPAIASPAGVNKQIIDNGVNGYICRTEEEWVLHLTELLQDSEKRKAFGREGRKKIEQAYSLQANASNFLSLFS